MFLMQMAFEKKNERMERSTIITRSFSKIEYDVIYQFIESSIQQASVIKDKFADEFKKNIISEQELLLYLPSDLSVESITFLKAWYSLLCYVLRHKSFKNNI